MLKKLLSCAVFLLLLSAAGCGQKQIMLMNAPLDTGDKVPEIKFPYRQLMKNC